MKLVFLGSGSAFTVGHDNYQSNMLMVSKSGKCLLLDCGTDIRFSLNEQGYKHSDIDAIYISHVHADHIGGLEWLGFSRKFLAHPPAPTLYTSQDIIEPLWANSIRGGMESLAGEKASLDSYFKLHPIDDTTKTFTWEGCEFELVKTFHVMHGNEYKPCYGLLCSFNNSKYMISMDTRFEPEHFAPYFKRADLIFHDCETSEHRTGVHAHYDDLRTLENEFKEKMWLYDYNDGPLPNCQDDGFIGFVKKGQIFDF